MLHLASKALEHIKDEDLLKAYCVASLYLHIQYLFNDVQDAELYEEVSNQASIH